jgi:hypothetical protein
MVLRLAGWRAKGLATGYAEITFVDVADAAKKADGFGEICRRCENYVEVDDGFGGKARNCGAADVFDSDYQRAESGLNLGRELQEGVRP